MPKTKITYDDRVDIEMMLQDKISKSMISELKGISRGALYNEIEKGKDEMGEYRAILGQKNLLRSRS